MDDRGVWATEKFGARALLHRRPRTRLNRPTASIRILPRLNSHGSKNCGRNFRFIWPMSTTVSSSGARGARSRRREEIVDVHASPMSEA